MLLELPPEIIQNILWHMDPGTLLISLLVCKRLYQIARSKDVLLHQLSSIPGLLIGLEDLSTSEALRQYRQRAARNLCGTDMLVQITRYQAGRDKINVPRCVFCPGSPPRLAIVFQYLSVIKLYGIEGGSLCPKADLEAQLFPYGNQECHIEVLKVAFSQAGHVAALYRYTPSDIGIGGPFLAEAFRRSKRTLKLVVFDLPAAEAQRTTGGICNPSDFQDARDIMVHGDFSPVSLTIANNGTAGISWARTGHRVNTKFSLYKRYDDTLGACRFGQCPCVHFDSALPCLLCIARNRIPLFLFTGQLSQPFCPLSGLSQRHDCDRE